MKTYLFRIAVWPDSQGFSLPEKEWGEHGITTETSGVVLAPICSEGWDEPFAMPPQYVCNEFAFAQFFHWLQTAMDLHGYSLAPERYSPVQLYEALSMSWQYAFAVEGGIPDDPIPDPDHDLEENGYGELCWQPTEHPSSKDEEAGKILESAQVRTPSTTEENIQRGREAMKRVIARHVDEPRAMYRKNVGWVSFPWGRPGTPPPIFQTDEAALTWWQALPNKFALFSGGYGVSHILAKRDWEGKWIKELLGQNGEEIALALVTTIAKGRIEKKGASISISFNPTKMEAILRKTQGQARGEEDESYLLTGYRVVASKNYTFIGESADDSGGVDDPLCRPTQNMHHDMLWGQSKMTDGRTVPTHSMLTLYPHGMGAADSVDKNIPPTLPKSNPTSKGNAMNAVFERTAVADMDTIEREVRTLTTFEQIESLFQRLFGLSPVIDPDSYKNEDSDYGLKVRGKKTREKINAQCKEILTRVNDPADLTAEDRAVLLQYSGRGGLTENSQYEYYTPTPVAEGVWEALKANGFGNGNVLDPCCFTPDTLVATKEGIKPISKVQVGTSVFSHDGEWHKVERVIEKPNETPLTAIKSSGFFDIIRSTPEHELYAVKTSRCTSDRSRFCHMQVSGLCRQLRHSGSVKGVYRCGEPWKQYKPEWIKAHCIEQGDYLVERFDTTVEDISGIDLYAGKERHPNAKGKSYLPFSDSVLKVFGLYVSDGCVDENSVIFTVNDDDLDIIATLKEAFGSIGLSVNKKEKRNNHASAYRIHSRALVSFFSDNFGKISTEKHLPQWAMTLPSLKQTHLLWGLLRGDGSTTRDGFNAVSTTSIELANGIRNLLLRQGILATFKKGGQTKSSFIGGKEIKRKHVLFHIDINGYYASLASKMYGIEHPVISNRQFLYERVGFIQGGHAFHKVTQVSTLEYMGNVYDLTVTDAHSYRLVSQTVHNCGSGVFEGTKPAGVVITGNDLDPTSSKIAALLNPGDHISTQPFERLAVNTPDNTFDSCVTNVPFGNARGASMHEDPAFKKEKQIERYFLLRILDKIRPGGLACLVCPINIVGAKGKKWEEFRIAVSKKAEFLGAHKLPSKTFAAQGTETVVDVIVLRKHGSELLGHIDDIPFATLEAAKVVWSPFIKGKYWEGEGKPFIMGKYVPKAAGDRWSREEVQGEIDAAALKQKLAQKFHSRIDWEALSLAEPVTRNYSDGDKKVVNGTHYTMTAGEWVKDTVASALTTIDPQKYGANTVEELEGILSGERGALSLSLENMFSIYKSYPNMLSALQKEAVEFAMGQPKAILREQLYRGVILGGMMARMSARSEAGEDVSAERAALQELVVADLERFGHPKNNKGLVLAGEGSRMFGLFKNAVDEEGHFSDLLAGTLDKRKEKRAYNPADPADIVVHLVVREGQEDVWLEDVQKRYQGDAPIASLGDIAEREGIAITPEGRIMPMNRYCAGDIYQKMAECAEAMAKASDERVKAKFQAQIDEMLRRRVTTKSEDIVFGMRHKWFSKKYVIDFLRENGYRNIEFGSEKVVEVTRYDGTLEKEFRFVADYENPDGEYRSSVSGGFDSQFLKYLNGEKITSNKAETKQEYIEKVASLEAQFNVWMQQHPDIEDMAATYNRQFNSYVPFEYEGTPLGIEDYLSGEISPHTYQNAEVRRLSEQGAGICGFGVGLGKSFTALAMAAYNHKRGRAKRTCIVVPAAVQENWYHEARQFYAEGYMRKNVFFVGLEPKLDKKGAVQRKPILDEQGQPRQGHDGQPLMQDVVIFTKSKEQIHDAMWKIPQSNFSLVVMTKEKFESIPLKQSTKRGYTEEMVSRSLMSEGLATKINEGKKSYKDDKQISNIEARYSATGGEKAQELPFLEDMGFDSIITDESHFYKNSFEPGKRSQGIAYLPTAKAANQAIDMAIKSHYIRAQNNGRGVYGLTATPVTNSPFEIFNMLSLVAPIEEFKRFGVHTVDDFVRVFGKTETISKLTVSGEVKDVEGLVGFQNLDGLRNLFHKYVNVKTVKDVDGEIHVPTAEEQEENVEMSEEQKELYATLRKRAKEAAKPGPKKGSDSIFSIIRDMDRLTTDIDMFHHTMTFVFQEKDREAVTRLASKLPETWLVTEKDEETREEYEHEVTVDRSLHENGAGTFALVVPETMEDVVLMRFPELGIEEAEVAHPVTPKYAQLIENLKKHFETGGKQIVFTEEKTQHNKLRRIIVHHLPLAAGKIGIINGPVAVGDKLDRISKAYNAGELKIVIANKKAEVGVNLQKGTTAIHHLTLPWTPASINQRNGRGVRQGNKADSVAVYYYCGKGTFDSYRKDLLKAKSNWINDLLMGEAKTMENGDVTGLDELLDMLADNPEEAKRMRAERLAAQNAKREEAFRINLINKMQVLASIQKNLDSIEERKATKKAALEEQRGTAQRSVSKYEAMASNDTLSTEDRAKAGEKLASAKRRLAEAERDLSTLDEKFEKFRQKQENQKKMNVSLLRQAEREGRLPFDAALIDRPGDVVASTEGKLFAVGETLEFKPGGSIHKITAVNAQEKTVTLAPIIGGNGPGRSFRIADIPEHIKVSYSESELAVKKLLVETWVYSKIRSSGIDKDMFLSHINEIRIRWSSGAVIRVNGKLDVVWDGTYSYTPPEGAVPVWPEPENESFKKAVLTRYLERVRAGQSRFSTLLEALFGPDYQSMAQEYGQRGTDAEILEKCSALWETYKKNYRLDTAQAVEQAFGTRLPGITREVLDPIYQLYDNGSDIERIFKDFSRGLQEKAKRQAEEERREAERAATEKLKADPRYKEVPEDIAKKFSDRGIIVRINREETYLPGFKGRAGLTHEPFSRWFFQDSAGVGGILYRMKDVLKTRYDAKFTKDWRERDGAWWHVSSTIDIQELYELLS